MGDGTYPFFYLFSFSGNSRGFGRIQPIMDLALREEAVPGKRTTFPVRSLADIFPINVVGLLFSVIVSAADELISVARLKDSESLGLVLCSNSSKLETPSPSISSS